MSDFLKNLNEALANKIYIEAPLMQFGRNGDVIGGSNEIKLSSLKQFVVTPYEVTDNPSINTEYHPEVKGYFTIESIQDLVKLISGWSLKIKFVPLILPYGVMKAEVERHNHIVGRYIENYLPATDEISKRWDFLIQKLD